MPESKPFDPLDPPATESPPLLLSPLDEAANLGRLFDILGDPRGKKIQVLSLLCEERLSVRELAERMNWNIGGLSQWLTRLHLAGIVIPEQEGHKKIYKLADGVVPHLTEQLTRVLRSEHNGGS